MDVQVAKLKVLKADHQSQKFRLQDKLLTKFPADIRETNAYIAGVKADAQLAAAHPQVQEGFCGMTIVNYARTRPVYDAYRKAGYSKKFLEEHREQITLHKAAKAAFDEANLKKLPKVKELDAEYAALLSQKKAAYPAYRKARDKMQELKKAQKNVELFFTEEKDTKEKLQTR